MTTKDKQRRNRVPLLYGRGSPTELELPAMPVVSDHLAVVFQVSMALRLAAAKLAELDVRETRNGDPVDKLWEIADDVAAYEVHEWMDEVEAKASEKGGQAA